MTSLRDVSASGTQKGTFVQNGRTRFRFKKDVQSGMTNSFFNTCMRLPTESYEKRLLLVEKGTIRLVVLQILTIDKKCFYIITL